MSERGAGSAGVGLPEPLSFLKDGVAQVGFVVKDLEATVEAYHRLFGIGPWHFYTYGKPLVKRMTRRGRPTEYRMRVALSWLGPLRIELIQPLEGDTVYEEFVREHGYGVHHLGILVKDADAALASAAKVGLAMTMDGAGFGVDGDGHYAYLDTDALLGTTIELIERPRGRMAPEKVWPAEPLRD
jgi:methylmalonyl-CoA/ethylmalonyl-CoA epimerase